MIVTGVMQVAVAAGAAAAGACGLIGGMTAWLPLASPPVRTGEHGEPVPTGAGLAIVLVTTLFALAVGGLHRADALRLVALLLPATTIAALSFVDDCRPLPVGLRLAVHAAAALAAVAALGPIHDVPCAGWGTWELGAWAWPATVLWLVGLTNAFNFMDGIDGLAGLVAAVTGVALTTACLLGGDGSLAIVTAAFTGSCIGFLWHNWQPARVFMGDVGSTFCGFLLATLPLASTAARRPALLAVAGLAVGPFILDTGLTLLRRLVRGENVFRPHRSHLYQRLVAGGWSHRTVALLYAAACAALAALGLAVLP